MVKSDKWLNRHNAGIRFYLTSHTSETREKIGAANSNPSPETRAKIGMWHKGKIVSPETRAKIGDGNRGKTITDEHKKAIGDANKDKIVSVETRAKLSILQKDKVSALNIETGIVAKIPKELYDARRDIYFHITSKVYKNWKLNQS